MFSFFRIATLSVILLGVALAIISIHYVGFLQPVENIVVSFFAPIQAYVYKTGVGITGMYDNLVTNKDLKEENEKLQLQVEELTVENAQLSALLKTQEQQLVQKNFLDTMGLSAVSARIIGKNPEPNLKAIILDKGSNAGVSEGDPIIVSNGVIIGKISTVNPMSSEGILINDSRSRIASTVKGNENTKGVVAGEHGLSLKMELILKNENIIEGDVVLTSGIEPKIPPGLVIGTINRIVTEANSFSKTAWIQPLIDIDGIIFVSVLKQNENN